MSLSAWDNELQQARQLLGQRLADFKASWSALPEAAGSSISTIEQSVFSALPKGDRAPLNLLSSEDPYSPLDLLRDGMAAFGDFGNQQHDRLVDALHQQRYGTPAARDPSGLVLETLKRDFLSSAQRDNQIANQ